MAFGRCVVRNEEEGRLIAQALARALTSWTVTLLRVSSKERTTFDISTGPVLASDGRDGFATFSVRVKHEPEEWRERIQNFGFVPEDLPVMTGLGSGAPGGRCEFFKRAEGEALAFKAATERVQEVRRLFATNPKRVHVRFRPMASDFVRVVRGALPAQEAEQFILLYLKCLRSTFSEEELRSHHLAEQLFHVIVNNPEPTMTIRDGGGVSCQDNFVPIGTKIPPEQLTLRLTIGLRALEDWHAKRETQSPRTPLQTVPGPQSPIQLPDLNASASAHKESPHHSLGVPDNRQSEETYLKELWEDVQSLPGSYWLDLCAGNQLGFESLLEQVSEPPTASIIDLTECDPASDLTECDPASDLTGTVSLIDLTGCDAPIDLTRCDTPPLLADFEAHTL